MAQAAVELALRLVRVSDEGSQRAELTRVFLPRL